MLKEIERELEYKKKNANAICHFTSLHVLHQIFYIFSNQDVNIASW